MALTTTFTNPKGGQVALRNTGSIFITIATGGATYATASGGVAVDLTATLATASSGGIAVGDIIDIVGLANLGYSAVFTFSSASTYNMRLYNGITEIADGAITQTVKAIIFLAGGSLK